MTQNVKILFKEAQSNDTFINDVLTYEPDWDIKKITDNNEGVILAAIYYGWLISKKQYADIEHDY